MRNLWDLPLQRLEIYCQPFIHPGGYFKVSPQASCIGADWIGLERYLAIIEETIPFRVLTTQEKLSLILQHLRAPSITVEQNVCVLIDYLNTRASFFHWFLDALPRIFAAETFSKISGDRFSVVVPQPLTSWQKDSLRFLNGKWVELICVSPAWGRKGWSFERLITSFSHRHTRQSTSGHFDAYSPTALHELSKRLISGADRVSDPAKTGKRIYLSRGNANLRQVRNEEAVMKYLSPYGFEFLHLDSMTLQLQIQRFRQATHVISAHGAGLTNLLYISPGCQILEIFQESHGLRPDFFQLAALRGGLYSFFVVPSINAQNDIEIPLAVLSRFLEASI